MGMRIKIDTDALGIEWVKNTNYRVELDEGVFVEVGNNRTPNTANANLYSFTTNATGPSLSSFLNEDDGKSFLSNTKLKLNFNRKIKFNTTGVVSLYSGNNVLIKEYNISDPSVQILDNVLVIDLTSEISLLFTSQPQSSYYILINSDAIVDFDNFDVVGVINSTEITFTINKVFYVFDNPNNFGLPDNDRFSSSLAISENYIAIGAPGEDDPTGELSGAVYIFDKTTRQLVNTLINPNIRSTGAGDQFGLSVAIHNHLIVVGAPTEQGPNDQPRYGAAYVFDIVNGNLLSTLEGVGTGSFFGAAVLINSDFIIVSAPGGGLNVNGNVRVYSTSGNFIRNITIAGNGPQFGGNNFGQSIAIDGNILLVGAPQVVIGSSFVGAAYVFNVSTGSLLHTLSNTSGQNLVEYGNSVSISNNLYFVGTPGLFSGRGAVFVFNSNGTANKTISSPGNIERRFGAQVFATSNYVVISGPTDNSSGGIVYIYNSDGSNRLADIDNPNAFGSTSQDNFGRYIFSDNDLLLVGTRWEDDALNNNSGKAYIYKLSFEVS